MTSIFCGLMEFLIHDFESHSNIPLLDSVCAYLVRLLLDHGNVKSIIGFHFYHHTPRQSFASRSAFSASISRQPRDVLGWGSDGGSLLRFASYMCAVITGFSRLSSIPGLVFRVTFYDIAPQYLRIKDGSKWVFIIRTKNRYYLNKKTS